MKPLNSELQKCIDDCNACITAARICLDQHLGEPDMKKCHQFCLDCIALCIACVQLLASQSDYSKRLCAICECAKFDSEVCQQCAEKCYACAESCKKMAA